jgi:hypothetical protein
MSPKHSPLLAAALALTAWTVPAQVGQPLPAVELTSFTGTEATAIDDFKGRLILIEFFAHW